MNAPLNAVFALKIALQFLGLCQVLGAANGHQNLARIEDLSANAEEPANLESIGQMPTLDPLLLDRAQLRVARDRQAFDDHPMFILTRAGVGNRDRIGLLSGQNDIGACLPLREHTNAPRGRKLDVLCTYDDRDANDRVALGAKIKLGGAQD